MSPRAVPPSDAVTPAGLPARSRKRRPAQDALHAPTVPTGLPVTVARPSTPTVAVAGDARTADADADPPSPTVEGPVTDAGLPVRVRQANLAPELRDPPTGGETGAGAAVRRAPEQVRQMMSAYQSGTRRGRTDAARLSEGTRSGDRSDDADRPAT
ncbi:hypothetical protein [Micromonospora sp. RL09-050-HVF-A]|uniref:hypothetical protein n=1 Tax=Micromonospora sp. RL09-050-HVF-A TaxID=1703433 RepID=UPI002105243D|nr:hypothetical protein [Micromonospora sp. RL09-050-HVF-A]